MKEKRTEKKGKMFITCSSNRAVVCSRFSHLASHLFLFSFLLLLLFCTSVQAKTYYASSPNNKLVIEITIEDAVMNYSVSYNNVLIVHRGQMGYNVKNSTGPREWYLDESTNPKMETIRETWKPVHGYKSEYSNVATVMSIPVRTYTGEKMTVQIRAANEGVAFRYIFSEGFGKAKEYVLDRELTTFPFAKDFQCYYTNTPQGAYENRTMSSCPPMVPAVIVEIEKGNLYATIAEAGNTGDFPPMVLVPNKEMRNILNASMRKDVVKVSGAITSPWRIIMIAEHPGRFVENAYLLQNLNEPCAIKDTSWILVGKVTRNTSCQRPDSDKWVDFNVANNYQAVHWDTGWNGQEFDTIPDHPTKIDGNRDLLGAIKYAHEKGQKIFLYCNARVLKQQQFDETFKTYKQWGVDGIKVGFVDWETAQDINWIYQLIKKAADYKLMVNIHDNYRPTGFERTYPNLVSVEGIAGNECHDSYSAMPQSRIMMAFIRPINGMADFTPCFLDSRVRSRSFQLACGLIFFNPLQHIHWYDKPLEPNQTKYPELEFWSQMPTTWDDTKVVDGVLGEYIIVARRKGSRWFVSAITNKAQTLSIPLTFLNDGLGEDFRQFDARIYRENSERPLQCQLEHRSVNAIYSLQAVMGNGGGYNVILTPEDELLDKPSPPKAKPEEAKVLPSPTQSQSAQPQPTQSQPAQPQPAQPQPAQPQPAQPQPAQPQPVQPKDDK